MEINETKVFNFHTMVNGRGFSFSVQADSHAAACQQLHDDLRKILQELADGLNQFKGKLAN